MGARLTANPHWRSASGNVGEVRIVFRASTEEEPLDEWLEGRYDLQLARDAPVAAADTVAERSPTLSTSFLGFNAEHELIADERVRRALAHAIDRAALVAAAPGVDLAAGRGGAIPPVMPGHGDAAGVAYDPGALASCSPRPATPAGRPAGAARRCAAVVADRGARPAARRDRRAHALRDARQVVRRLAPDARVVHGLARRLSRPGRLLPRPARAGAAALPRRRDERRPRARPRVARPRRAAAPVPRVRAHLDRPARGDRPALVRPPAGPAAAARATDCGSTRWARSISSRS